ncbi:MAG: hypothetical protein ACRDAU_05735 [Clostridium sp.]
MKKLDLKFEIKSLNKISILPLVLIICSIGYTFFMKNNYNADPINGILPSLEFLFAPGISIWIVYLFYDYYENKSLEIILSYPLKNRNCISDRVLSCTAIYMMPLSLLVILSYFTDNNIALVFVQIIPQIIFFSGLATLITSLFKSTVVGLCSIIAYVSTEVLTHGELLPWYHVFYFNNTPLPLENLLLTSVINLILGISMIFISNMLLRGNS